MPFYTVYSFIKHGQDTQVFPFFTGHYFYFLSLQQQQQQQQQQQPLHLILIGCLKVGEMVLVTHTRIRVDLKYNKL